MAPPNIISLKQDFVRSQVRILSGQSLAPSRSWRDAVDAAQERASRENKKTKERKEDGNPAKRYKPKEPAPLSESAVNQAVSRANNALHQHCSRAYPPQATRFVAEQIDRLYWSTTGLSARADDVPDSIRVGADLSMYA